MSGILQKLVPGFTGSGIFGKAFGVFTEVIPGGHWSTILSRNTVRIHFPKPKETKRITVHGWKKRLSTAGGKRVIMRRLLKGRHALSH